MKFKRLIAVLCLLLCITTGASASLASLDTALAPLLEGQDAVSMSVSMQLKTLMPFDDTRIDLINRVLKHAVLDLHIASDTDSYTTGFQISLGDTQLMMMAEQYQCGNYMLQTSLLPNRMLFSTQASPMDTLLAAADAEDTADEEETTLNTSDVETAFDMLAAVEALNGYYRTLIDQTVPLTEKNTPNYAIENIGRGRISYVAKLTTEQSEALAEELHTMLTFGMDADYCQELSQVTFAKGFVVALYQNEDAEDICVYIKGTVIYPDGDRRTLKWQWAFTPDRETQTFTFEAARESGTRDSRVINAILKRTEDETSYTISLETMTNLRRSSLNETSTYTVELGGALGDMPTCAGSLTRVTGATLNGEDTGETQTDIAVDLSLLEASGGAEISGTGSYMHSKDNTVQTELEITFTSAAAAALAAAQAQEQAEEETSSPVVVSIIAADPAQAQQNAETPTTTAEETQTEQPEFLVGTAPLGLYDYEIPADMTTISMDTTESKVHQSLMNEAVQRLAGNLVTAILDLPAEDRVLLSDGMTEEDYAIFLAMLD